MALTALEAAAAHPDELTALAERATRERDDLDARLAQITTVRRWPSATNYVLIEVPDGAAVVTALRQQRIAVRAAASFPGLDSRHIRLTARDPDANARLAAAFSSACRLSDSP
jgi:histidinol-phosphate aminotransferase